MRHEDVFIRWMTPLCPWVPFKCTLWGFFSSIFKKEVPWKWLESLIACLVWAQKNPRNHKIFKIFSPFTNLTSCSVICDDFLQPSNQGLCAILGLLCNLELCQTSFLLGPRVSGENRKTGAILLILFYPVNKGGGKIFAAFTSQDGKRTKWSTKKKCFEAKDLNVLVMQWKYKEKKFHNIFILMLIWN